MRLNYVLTRSTVRPESVDEASSKTTVYIRRNIQEKTEEPTELNDGAVSTYYEYEEAKLSKEQYAEYLEYMGISDSMTDVQLALAEIYEMMLEGV